LWCVIVCVVGFQWYCGLAGVVEEEELGQQAMNRQPQALKSSRNLGDVMLATTNMTSASFLPKKNKTVHA